MTEKNKELRSIVVKVENLCVSCLRHQPTEDADCEMELVKALSKIADMVGRFAGMSVIEAYDITWETDGESVDLPTSAKMIVDGAPEPDGIVDKLSDEFGWLVKGFKWRYV